MRIILPKQVKTILDTLESRGFSAYIVGGCVRDSLLGGSPHDWDITTSALPEEIIACFPTVEKGLNGLKHGTVMLIFDHSPYEITTFRADGKYLDARHPEQVTFLHAIDGDLSRRDFTINAMAYSESHGLIDLFHGEKDIQDKLIRCVGDPSTRFSEDALRIMRALRFSSVLGFSIHKETACAIYEKAPLLKKIASERLTIELKKLLCGNYAKNALLPFQSVLAEWIPPLSSLLENQWQRNLTALSHAEQIPEVRLALLFYGLNNPAAPLKELTLSRKERTLTLFLLSHMEDDITPASIPFFLEAFEKEAVTALLKAKEALNPGSQQENCSELEKLLAENFCYKISMLAVNGNDIKALGITDGLSIKSGLSHLLTLVMQKKIRNQRDQLIPELIRFFKL